MVLRAAPTEYAAAFRSFVDNGSSHLFVFWYQIVHVSDSGVIHKPREQDFGCFWPLPSPWLFTFTTECEQFFEIFNSYPPSGCSRSSWMTPNVIYKIQYRVECYKTTVIQCCYVNCYISYLKMSFIQICEYFIQYFVCKQKINKISLRFVSIFSVFCLQTKIWIKYILTNLCETHFQVK